MSQKLFVNEFKWIGYTSEFKEDFMKSYTDESNEIYFFKIDVQRPKYLHKLHNDLPFLNE